MTWRADLTLTWFGNLAWPGSFTAYAPQVNMFTGLSINFKRSMHRTVWALDYVQVTHSLNGYGPGTKQFVFLQHNR